MWSVIDAVYRWCFKHAAAIVLIAIILLGYYALFVPNCPPAVERAKVARVQSDFRWIRQVLYDASQGLSTAPVALPLDPFAPDGQTCQMLISSGTLTMFSIGPDEVTNDGAFEYDPTNGTVSPGDVISTIATSLRYSVQ